MSSATLVFPHQLFRHHPAIDPGRPVYLIEETLFFHALPFHKKKLVLHRASMKAYAEFIAAICPVHYIQAIEPDCDLRRLIGRLKTEGIGELHLADPVDDWLGRRLQKSAAAAGIRLKIYPSPNFLNSPEEAAIFFKDADDEVVKKGRTYFLADFYIAERKKRKWLLDESGKPLGGKWSHDAANRKRLPATQRLSRPRFPEKNVFVTEAIDYASQYFPANPGDLSPLPGGGFYPVSFDEADDWLEHFLEERFRAFGPYQDAMRSQDHFLFHSVLTPVLNIGLLDPAELIGKIMLFAENKKIPLASVEGFLRQVMGWREFIRIVYEREGRKQRTRNFWQFSRKIPPAFRTGSTGIPPVDEVVKKLLSTGYAHHIERLMVLGNFMLLCEFDPDEVYRFFMELFIDAYDWVMVPNIYGMSQFADGGMITTKPYLSSSNYLMKLGDWQKGTWEKKWDGLFWRFLHVHRDLFGRHPRWKMLMGQWEKMPAEVKAAHLGQAEIFLHNLDDPSALRGETDNVSAQIFF